MLKRPSKLQPGARQTTSRLWPSGSRTKAA
jgi:hypothetical protein